MDYFATAATASSSLSATSPGKATISPFKLDGSSSSSSSGRDPRDRTSPVAAASSSSSYFAPASPSATSTNSRLPKRSPSIMLHQGMRTHSNSSQGSNASTSTTSSSGSSHTVVYKPGGNSTGTGTGTGSGRGSARASPRDGGDAHQHQYHPHSSSSSNDEAFKHHHSHYPPAPTAKPFKVPNAHPSAFPVHNGASAGFQQAVMARQNSGPSPSLGRRNSGAFGAVPETPLHHPSTTMTNSSSCTPSTTSSTATASGAPAEASSSSSSSSASSSTCRLSLNKRYNGPSHASTAPKSVRTPVITSPKRPEAVSPVSSSTSPALGQHPSAAPTHASQASRSQDGSRMMSVPLTASASWSSSTSPSTSKPHSSQASPMPMPKMNVSSQPSESESSGPSSQRMLSPSKSLTLPLSGPLAGPLTGPRSFTVGPGVSALSSSVPAGGASCVGTAMRRTSTVQNPRFKMVTFQKSRGPQALPAEEVLTESPSTRPTIVIDLRPHTAYVTQGRIKDSMNVCVPSTLLRRPNFGLTKIAETLCSRRDRRAFNDTIVSKDALPDAQQAATRVIVLDQETSFLQPDSVLTSLLSKIEKHGFKGELCWLQGGFNALVKAVEFAQDDGHPNPALLDRIDFNPLSETDEEDEEEEEEETDEDVGRMEDGMRMQDSPLPINPASAVHHPEDSSSSHRYRSSSSSLSSASDSLFATSVGSSSVSSLAGTSPSTSVISNESGSGSGTGKQHSLSSFDSRKLALPPKRMSNAASMSKLNLAGMNKDKSAAGGLSKSHSSTPVIRPRHLPLSAFTFGSTAAAFNNSNSTKPGQGGPSHGDAGSRTGSGQSSGSAGASWRSAASSLSKLGGAASAEAGNDTNGKPEYPTVSGKGEMRGSKLQSKAAANPFFDNIRQNIESASLESVLAHVNPMELPKDLTKPKVVKHMPAFLQNVVALTPRSRAEKLHREFYEIEQNEQKRLQKVLAWHCSQSQCNPVLTPQNVSSSSSSKSTTTATPSGFSTNDRAASGGNPKSSSTSKEAYHPFSISAGVEKGHLNRYKNMWPYEHARVRLAELDSPTCGDYINASHIRLRGTDKEYIASQGPLEGTAEHFWKLVLQEKVSVIVMLTLLLEGGREKCFNYFKTGTYGSIQVTLKEEKGDIEAVKQSLSEDMGFFTLAGPASNANNKTSEYEKPAKQRDAKKALDEATVRRILEVRNKDDPTGTPPHIVHHIQYIRWPDFDIPPDPQCVVDLIAETNRAQRLATTGNAPVLVHCSAGVGRTGTFIAVDTLLERYRRERQELRERHEMMDVDPKTPPQTQSGGPLGSSYMRQSRSASSASNSAGMQAMNLQSVEQGNGTPSDVSTPAAGFSGSSSNNNSNPSTPSRGSFESTRAIIAKLEQRDLLPQDITDPVKSLVDQMREQRMSSVANAGQYVFTYLALMAGIARDLKDEGLVDESP